MDAKLLTDPEHAWGWRLKQMHTIDSVSYTHLRAHETVLDLVCRLLLEKKTTHVMTPQIIVRFTKAT